MLATPDATDFTLSAAEVSPASDDEEDEEPDGADDDVVVGVLPCAAPFVWLARLALARPVLLRAAVERFAAPVVPRFALAARLVAAPPVLAAPVRLAAPVLRLAVLVPRLAVAPRFAVLLLAVLLLAVLLLAVLLLAVLLLAVLLLAVLRFAAPRLAVLAEPAPRAREVEADLRAPDAAPFLAAERRDVEALLAPARPDDARLELLPPDVERLRALDARFVPVLLFERPLDRLPLLLALLRDDFVAMCGLLRGGCAANVASSAHGPQLSFWIARA